MWNIEEEEFENDVEEYFEDFSQVVDFEDVAANSRPALVLPGHELGNVTLKAGPGTYVHNDVIYAGICGQVEKNLDTICINGERRHTIPKPGSEVLARVIRVSPRLVICDIFAFDDTPLPRSCRGNIRPPDIQSIGIDQISLLDCFRPGDLIKAQILATGVARTFLLSTAGTGYGVVRANHSVTKELMVAVASNLMRCSRSGALERRKVALIADVGGRGGGCN